MKYTGKNPDNPGDRSNWTLDNGTPLSDEQWTQFEQWHKSGAPSAPAPAAAGEDNSLLGKVETGAQHFLRGAGRGLIRDLPYNTEKGSSKDVDIPEKLGRLTGEYGPLAGLEFLVPEKLGLWGLRKVSPKIVDWLTHQDTLDAIGKVVGADNAPRVIHAIFGGAPKAAIAGAAMDPQHPGEGALSGALAVPGIGAIKSGWRAAPQGVRSGLATVARKAGQYGIPAATSFLGAGAATRTLGGMTPLVTGVAHSAVPALSALAGASLKYPTAAGALGSEARKTYEGETEGDDLP